MSDEPGYGPPTPAGEPGEPRSLEAAAERILQGFTALVARLGCGAVGCVGLVGGGGLLSFKPQRGSDLTGGGLYLLASAVAFGALAFISAKGAGRHAGHRLP